MAQVSGLARSTINHGLSDIRHMVSALPARRDPTLALQPDRRRLCSFRTPAIARSRRVPARSES